MESLNLKGEGTPIASRVKIENAVKHMNENALRLNLFKIIQK